MKQILCPRVARRGLLKAGALAPVALVVLALFQAGAVSAQTANWIGGVGTYSTAAGWSTATVPSATTAVAVSSGTVTYSDVGTLTTDYFTRTAATTISGTGTLNVTNNRVEIANTGNASFSVSGTGGFNQLAGQYFVVAHAGIGNFSQSGGTVSSSVTGGWFLSDNAGSVGNYNLTGGNLNVTVTGTLAGSANYGVNLGKNSGSDVLAINGGTANFRTNGTTDVRTYISNGAILRADSGTATFNQFTFLTVGRATSATTSQVIVDGGTLSFTNMLNNGGTGGGFSIGNGGAGLISVSSGLLNMAASAGVTDYVMVGDGANGAISLTGGAISTNMGIVLSNKTGNTGTFTMSAGTLTALGISQGAGALGAFNFSGGEIFLTGNQTSLLQATWFTGVTGTTATYDAVSNTTEIYVAPVPEPASAAGWIALASLAAAVRWRRRIPLLA